jgi:hypothetical protein
VKLGSSERNMSSNPEKDRLLKNKVNTLIPGDFLIAVMEIWRLFT